MLRHIIRRGFGNWTVGHTDEVLKFCAMLLLFVAVSPVVVGQIFGQAAVTDREFANLERSVREIEKATALQAKETERIIDKLDHLQAASNNQPQAEDTGVSGEQLAALLVGLLSGAGGLKAKQKIAEAAGA